jgi:hypothetical protein
MMLVSDLLIVYRILRILMITMLSFFCDLCLFFVYYEEIKRELVVEEFTDMFIYIYIYMDP